jgi:hypothetical protein
VKTRITSFAGHMVSALPLTDATGFMLPTINSGTLTLSKIVAA